MPITQDRMYALLLAAEDYRQALERAIQILVNAHNSVVNGEKSAEVALLALTGLRMRSVLTQPITSAGTLAAERRHFSQSTMRRNERQRAKQAAKRGTGRASAPQHVTSHGYDTIVAPRTTAPNRLDAEVRLYGSLLDEIEAQASAQAEPEIPYQPQPLGFKFVGLDEATKRQIEAQVEREDRERVWNETEAKRPSAEAQIAAEHRAARAGAKQGIEAWAEPEPLDAATALAAHEAELRRHNATTAAEVAAATEPPEADWGQARDEDQD